MRVKNSSHTSLIAQMGAIDQVPVRYSALLFGGDRFESRDNLMALIADHETRALLCAQAEAAFVATCRQGAQLSPV